MKTALPHDHPWVQTGQENLQALLAENFQALLAELAKEPGVSAMPAASPGLSAAAKNGTGRRRLFARLFGR
jgi:hypothetical protein